MVAHSLCAVMTGTADGFEGARVLVTGTDQNGRSGIIEDRPCAIGHASPSVRFSVIWESHSLPAREDDRSLAHANAIVPEPGGLKILVTTFAPDSEWQLPPSDTPDEIDEEKRRAAFHQTPTIDIITLVSGELYAVMEDGETLMRPGDTLIQNGTLHGWRNRSDQPATITGVLLSSAEHRAEHYEESLSP